MGAVRLGAAGSGAALGLLALLACASDLALVDGVYRHARHGYSFRDPGAPWQRVDLEGADVAYRAPGHALMSLRSTCGRPVAAPAVMARHLLIGIGEHRLLQAGPVALAGRDGWMQTFETRSDGTPVRVRTVTVVARGCSFDWLLAAPPGSEGAEREFEAWWSGFDLGAGA